MALFGSSRDVSFIRGMNREVMGNVISQQCSFYKYILQKTTVNLYGEASGGKFFDGPVLLNALITVGDQTSPTSELGVGFDWPMTFAFLRDDLTDASLVPEVGDIILYQESYWEVDNAGSANFFAGKDPEFPNSINPLNPGLDQFGYNISIVCECHYVPSDKLNLIKSRL